MDIGFIFDSDAWRPPPEDLLKETEPPEDLLEETEPPEVLFLKETGPRPTLEERPTLEDFLKETEPRPPPEDFSLKEIKPRLGAVKVTGDKHPSTYDLVEETQYIYVRIVKVKDLPMKDATGCHVEIIFGKDMARTRPLEEESNCEWNQVFAFPRYRSQSKVLNFIVRRQDGTHDDSFIGEFLLPIDKIPQRIPPDGPLAPQLYSVARGQLMMAVWKGSKSGDKHTSTYDLVEEKQYIYIRIVEATDLPGNDATGWYVEIKFGESKYRTRPLEEESNRKWNQDFAFLTDRSQSKQLDVKLRRKNDTNDDIYFGSYFFDMDEIPELIHQDGPPAPQLYCLTHGQLMMAVWWGNQADEEFPEAWNADQAGVSKTDGLAYVRSNVYLSPKFWYLRVNLIKAEGLPLDDMCSFTKVSVKAVLGNQVLRTGFSRSRNNEFKHDQELMFVVAEPITEPLILRVEDGVAPHTSKLLGRCTIPLQDVERRQDNKPVSAKWYNLERRDIVEGEPEKEENKSARMIYMRICLKGGYHVLDEPPICYSDLQPTTQLLRKTSIGVLELGILSAHILMPSGKTDTYCVAKYGQKWVRTRTITDSFTPRWNEQYTWEVFDPCTVLTIGLFGDCLLNGRIRYARAKDLCMGKVRIRLSTLETGRIYTHSYPLLVLNHNGVKKPGEIHLALRFTCSSFLRMMRTYSQPVLPKMHYLHPLTEEQLQSLRRQAVQIISTRFSLVDQPLRKDVVEYMLDLVSHTHMWSVKMSKANLSRLMDLLAGLSAGGKWLNQICHWENPITTILIHILFTVMVMYPGFILPAIFLCFFLIGIWNIRWRPRHPFHEDIRLSLADSVSSGELDEELDTFPTSSGPRIVKMRYDRLRSMAGKFQTVVSDLAAQGERVSHLLSWRDPRATVLFLIFFVVAAVIFCIVPFQVVVLFTGFYLLRHPRFRQSHPPPPLNIFRRLPDRVDAML